MNLKIENVAKVSRADVMLEGMSVIAGENGTGKSTIRRALMVMVSLSSRIKDLVLRERFASIFRDVVQKVLSQEGVQITIERPIAHSGGLKSFLDKDFWNVRFICHNDLG